MSQRPRDIIEVGQDFWNIRGSFKIFGVVDIGTHASLVRRRSGRFVLLDACALSEDVERWIREQTHGGEDIEAILHLHPFHTLHVRSAHRLFPRAKLHGTSRHAAELADLPWEPMRTEDPALHRAFADDFDFSVPRGVAFVPKNPRLHFSSVLSLHRASRTLHVDDTLLYMRLPVLRWFGRDVMRFHPTLRDVLEPGESAVIEFRSWMRELVDLARDAENLCAAHSAVLLGRNNKGASIAVRVEHAMKRAERVLDRRR